ncbi:MAG: HlyD family efflux transporter periplasmic adaptor subunit [Candidatus Hydrogenedentes bacterium]|nr:HlyD family efflux transporter periplasmic adaptor subunit [Candidatus Hydrogenedentota bacterium]
MRSAYVILAAICVLTAAGCYARGGNGISVTGQIEGVGIDAGSKVGGRVREVLVQEGARVQAGAVIVKLEADETDALVAAAKAKLAGAEALLEKLKTGAREEEKRQAEAVARQAEERFRMAVKGARAQEIQAARATANAAKAQRDSAEAEFKRIEKLRAGNAASQQAFDVALHTRDAAASQFQAASEKLDLLIQGTRSEEVAMAKAAADQTAAAYEEIRNGARIEDVQAAQAARDSAEADVKRAEANAREMVVTSPLDGVIESMDIHPGDLVKPGAFARIVDPEDLKLVVYVSAAMLGRLGVGQTVTLTTDAHGAETFQGTIQQIATQGEYTPRNLQTKEERVQQVFGIKIKLNSANGKLRAGMTAVAHFSAAGAETP